MKKKVYPFKELLELSMGADLAWSGMRSSGQEAKNIFDKLWEYAWRIVLDRANFIISTKY